MTLEAITLTRFHSEEIFARIFRASPVAISLSTLDEGRSTELGLWKVWTDRARVVHALRNRQQ